MKRGNIPVCWNINEFKELDYNHDLLQHTQPELAERYISAGHQPDAIGVCNYFDPNPMPNGVEQVRELFSKSFSNVDIAVNLFKPGQYLPYHCDLFGSYKKRYNLVDQDILRCIVMLEDSVDGQLIHIDGRVYSNWSAGNWFGWYNGAMHSFYNLSDQPRYALQITCTC